MIGRSLARSRLTPWVGALMTQALILTTGCAPSTPAATHEGTAVVVFVDFSQSITNEDRASFRMEIEKEILPSLVPGDRFLIAPINDKTLTDFRPLVEASLPAKPKFNGWFNNVMKFNRESKEIEAQTLLLKDKMKADRAAGNKDAVKADKEKLKADKAKRKADKKAAKDAKKAAKQETK